MEQLPEKIDQEIENVNKASERQKLVFRDYLLRIANGDEINFGKMMKARGYAEATAHNPEQNLKDTVGWKQLLSLLDESVILGRFYDIIINGSDKDSIKAGKEILKLKDKYPAKKSKVDIGLQQRKKYVKNPDEVEVTEND